jgi:two-component system phosphate regulon sensor histidine kinase PhoR
MKQNTTALVLMVASVLLLATSQWFWLRSEYKEHRRAFYSNSDLLFKETVRAIEDSLVSKMVAHELFQKQEDKQPEPPKIKKVVITRGASTLPYLRTEGVSDSLVNRESYQFSAQDSAQAVVLSDSGVLRLMIRSRNQEDTLNRLKRVIAQLPRMNFHTPEPEKTEERYPRRRFHFQSAPLDSVQARFRSRTRDMGYDLTFTVQKDSIKPDTSLQSFRRTIRTYSQLQRRLMTARDSTVINGVHVINPESITSFSIIPTVIFKAYPEDLDHYLLSKLKRNILFSLFLLIVTILTFWVIYRNLRKQERLNTLKNDLISNITHELKTPLATLSVALEALQQFGVQAKPETTKEYLEISQNEVSRLSLMVDNILKASLLEKQGVTLYPTNLDMEVLGRGLVRAWQPRFAKLNGELELDVRGGDFEMEADEVQVTSILNNLFDNALKYADGPPQVKVILEADLNVISVKVSDKGIGIPKEYQSQVFEKFFRVPTGDHHNVKGYGLGLNYVRHIMDLHQGLVTLESGSEGTTFILTFRRRL